MLISLSTGSIYKWTKNFDDLLDICRGGIKINGIEIMLANGQILEKFSINSKNVKWLRALSHVTLHAPVSILKEAYGDMALVGKQLKILEDIYNIVKAKAVIFHVTSIPEYGILREFNFKFIIENTTLKGNVDIHSFYQRLEEYRADMCLDVSHSFTWSSKEAEKYNIKFKDKIFQIHLSASSGGHEHLPLSASGDTFKESIKFLKNINKPIIIESDYNNNNLEFLCKDINFLFDLMK